MECQCLFKIKFISLLYGLTLLICKFCIIFAFFTNILCLNVIITRYTFLTLDITWIQMNFTKIRNKKSILIALPVNNLNLVTCNSNLNFLDLLNFLNFLEYIMFHILFNLNHINLKSKNLDLKDNFLFNWKFLMKFIHFIIKYL